MYTTYICVDPGILTFETKGTSVHIQDIMCEPVYCDHDVEIRAAYMGDHVLADLADVPIVEYPLDADGAGDRERAQAQASRVIAQRVTKSAPGLVQERYSLFSAALAPLAKGSGVRGILEMNAPLIEEQRRHRRPDDRAGAQSAFVEQSGAARVIICAPDPVRAWVEEMVGVECACTVLNGVDTNRITPVMEEVGRVAVTFVGTLKFWHGVEHLIEARALASSPWDLCITGDGPQREVLEEAACVAGVDAGFRGAVAPYEVPSHPEGPVIATTPYLVLIDEADHCFSPLKVYEYMAAGLPAIVNVLGQIPVALLGCDVLVPSSDTAVLIRAIDALVQDSERRTELGVQARLAAEERHSWEGVVEHVPELVEA